MAAAQRAQPRQDSRYVLRSGDVRRLLPSDRMAWLVLETVRMLCAYQGRPLGRQLLVATVAAESGIHVRTAQRALARIRAAAPGLVLGVSTRYGGDQAQHFNLDRRRFRALLEPLEPASPVALVPGGGDTAVTPLGSGEPLSSRRSEAEPLDEGGAGRFRAVQDVGPVAPAAASSSPAPSRQPAPAERWTTPDGAGLAASDGLDSPQPREAPDEYESAASGGPALPPEVWAAVQRLEAALQGDGQRRAGNDGEVAPPDALLEAAARRVAWLADEQGEPLSPFVLTLAKAALRTRLAGRTAEALLEPGDHEAIRRRADEREAWKRPPPIPPPRRRWRPGLEDPDDDPPEHRYGELGEPDDGDELGPDDDDDEEDRECKR